jgi:DNA-binding GntR family transcriptional regulator
VIEARSALELTIARLCATRFTSEQAGALVALVDRADDGVGPEGDPTELSRLGREFHRELANSCGNSILANICSLPLSVHDHPLWVLIN